MGVLEFGGKNLATAAENAQFDAEMAGIGDKAKKLLNAEKDRNNNPLIVDQSSKQTNIKEQKKVDSQQKNKNKTKTAPPTTVSNTKAKTGNSEKSIDTTSKLNDIYRISDEKAIYWWAASPYAFRSVSSTGTVLEFCLPLNPSNIQIVTHFATNMIPTMYGTIEEHSEQRYFDISLSGTTGFAPKYVGPEESNFTYPVATKEGTNSKYANPVYSTGRDKYTVAYNVDPNVAFGLFQKQLEMVNKTLDKARDLASPAFGKNDPIREVSGIDARKSGYIAFHNFYRFLLDYKKAAMQGKRDVKKMQTNPLCFVSYKDSTVYNVVIQTFQLTRSAEDPMMYNYNIVMRAYNLRSTADFTYNNAVPETQIAAQLGIDGITDSSIFSKIKDKVSDAKGTAASAASLINGF